MSIKDRLIVILYNIQFIFQLFFIYKLFRLRTEIGNTVLIDSFLTKSSFFILFSCIVWGIVIWRLLVLRNIYVYSLANTYKIYDGSMKHLSKNEIAIISILSANPLGFIIALFLIVLNYLECRNYIYGWFNENPELKKQDNLPEKLVSNIYIWLLTIVITLYIALPFWVYQIIKIFNISIAKINKFNNQTLKNL